MLISEIFYSIQGEGELVGVPSVFVRCAGCNLECDWCDTKYAWDENDSLSLSVTEIAERAGEFSASYCVLTGGEPMIAEDIHSLASTLRADGMHLTIETNATVAPDGIACDLASLSPKLSNSNTVKPIQIDIAQEWVDRYDCQLKFVVQKEEDISEITDFLLRLKPGIAGSRVFLMPEGGDAATVAARSEMVVELCGKHGYRFGQRLHLQLFDGKRGV